MRKITSGNPNTVIEITDEPGTGGANHQYQVKASTSHKFTGAEVTPVYAIVNFQNGPIKEVGVNGCHQEDLLAIVIDRLKSFQAGPFPCRENAMALTHCQEALHWLNDRTADRNRRGVEGKTEA